MDPNQNQANQMPPPPAYGAPPPDTMGGKGAPPPGYPMQQPGYPMQQQQMMYPPQGTTVMMTGQGQMGGQTTVILQGDPHCAPMFGAGAVGLICPHCHSPVQTHVDSTVSSGGIILAALLCLFGCWLCAWIPLVTDSYKEIKHTCPRCHVVLGIHRH